MQARSIPATPQITGAWKACPAMPNPINPTFTMLSPFILPAKYYDRLINLQVFADIARGTAEV
jgi:hypothetical protein